MSQWDQFETMLDQAVDDIFSERWLFEPMGKGDIIGPRPDPDRIVQEIQGIYTFKSELAVPGDTHGVGRRAKFGLKARSGEATLSVERSEFAEPPRQGDHFKRLEKSSKPVFRVVTIAEDGARLVITLQDLSRERGARNAQRSQRLGMQK